jgi:hypothetical protein
MAERGNVSASGGAGGGKAAGRGEHGPAKRVPDAEPGCERVKCAGACAAGCREGQGREVHRAPASRRCRSSPRRVSGVESEGGRWGRWRDVGVLWAGPGGEPPGSEREDSAGRLPAKPSRRVFIPKADGASRCRVRIWLACVEVGSESLLTEGGGAVLGRLAAESGSPPWRPQTRSDRVVGPGARTMLARS